MVAFTPAGTCAAVHPSVGWPSLTPVHEVGPARKTRVPSVITKPAMQVTPAIVTVTPGWTVARAADAQRGPAVAPGAPTSVPEATATAANAPAAARADTRIPDPPRRCDRGHTSPYPTRLPATGDPPN